MEQYELERPDARIQYWVRGPEDAPTVVFLHGATLDHHAWDAQVEALHEQYRTVTVDLRGHGESRTPGRFVFDAAVADFMALLHRLRATPLALVGHSFGGNIAQEIVYRAPDLVDALVVADSTCNTAPRHPLETTWAIAGLGSLGMTSREAFLQRAGDIVAGTRAWAEREPLGLYVTIPNAGHASNQDSPRTFTAELAAFLDRELAPAGRFVQAGGAA